MQTEDILFVSLTEAEKRRIKTLADDASPALRDGLFYVKVARMAQSVAHAWLDAICT